MMSIVTMTILIVTRRVMMEFVLVRIGVLLVSVGMIKVIRGEGWVRNINCTIAHIFILNFIAKTHHRVDSITFHYSHPALLRN